MRTLLALTLALLLITPAWGASATLDWDPSSDPDLAGYKVYYDTQPVPPFAGTGATEGPSPIDVGNVLTFDVTGLNAAQGHYFAVTAYNTEMMESVYSNIIYLPPDWDETRTYYLAWRLAEMRGMEMPGMIMLVPR